MKPSLREIVAMIKEAFVFPLRGRGAWYVLGLALFNGLGTLLLTLHRFPKILALLYFVAMFVGYTGLWIRAALLIDQGASHLSEPLKESWGALFGAVMLSYVAAAGVSMAANYYTLPMVSWFVSVWFFIGCIVVVATRKLSGVLPKAVYRYTDMMPMGMLVAVVWESAKYGALSMGALKGGLGGGASSRDILGFGAMVTLYYLMMLYFSAFSGAFTGGLARSYRLSGRAESAERISS